MNNVISGAALAKVAGRPAIESLVAELEALGLPTDVYFRTDNSIGAVGVVRGSGAIVSIHSASVANYIACGYKEHTPAGLVEYVKQQLKNNENGTKEQKEEQGQ